MKKIGILGGLAWPSTVEYYSGICRLAEGRHAADKLGGLARMPEIAIESLDVATAISLLGDDHDEASWAGFDAYHRAGLQRLQHSGADFAVIASNTAHHRFAQITHDMGMPVVNIVTTAAAMCARIGVTRVLILGTMPVMQSVVLRSAFAEYGVEAASLRNARAQRRIATTIYALQNGRIDGAAKLIHAIVAETGAGRLRGRTAIYLGCTELPLAFPEQKNTEVFEAGGTLYLNSTALHIQAAFQFATREPRPCEH